VTSLDNFTYRRVYRFGTVSECDSWQRDGQTDGQNSYCNVAGQHVNARWRNCEKYL